MKKILVIEDEQDVRENILELLSEEGYEVSGAADGEQGVSQVWGFLPDLIVCDILMPKLDGYGVLEKIAQSPSLATIPFLFLTARIGRDDMRLGMNLGADDYITKPFTRRDLLQAIEVRLGKQERIEILAQQKIVELRHNLTYSLPYEFLTPLSVILAGAELIDEQATLLQFEKIKPIVKEISRSAYQLRRLTQNYLLYAELETAVIDEARVADYRRVCADNCQESIMEMAQEKAIQVQRQSDLTCTIEPVSLGMDETHLMIIVEELVDNALKFCQRGRPVTVTGTFQTGGKIFRLAVKDMGVGMTPEQIRNIESFMQFDRKLHEQRGLGLGLFLVRRIVELYGGHMHLTSQPGIWTQVVVDLPITEKTS